MSTLLFKLKYYLACMIQINIGGTIQSENTNIMNREAIREANVSMFDLIEKQRNRDVFLCKIVLK